MVLGRAEVSAGGNVDYENLLFEKRDGSGYFSASLRVRLSDRYGLSHHEDNPYSGLALSA